MIMDLNIFSLKGSIYHGEIISLNVPTVAGEITVLAGHRPLISILKKGLLRIVDNQGGQKEFKLNGGFLEVQNGHRVSLIID